MRNMIERASGVMNASQGTKTVFEVVTGERVRAPSRKRALLAELRGVVESDQPLSIAEQKNEEEVFSEKIMDFRLRLVGAISLYSFFSGDRYASMQDSGGLDAAYLFWYLGASQDDIIDSFPKSGENDQVVSPEMIHDAIFSPDKKYLNGAHTLIQTKIEKSNMGDEQKDYLRKKIEKWYHVVEQQESEAISSPVSVFSFAYSKRYREGQNQTAGETVVALLNWDRCLDPKRQRLENVIPGFSFLTQMVDDILDTPEDLVAKKPSYSVGALVDNPQELEGIQSLIELKGLEYITPATLREYAPHSFATIDTNFQAYTETLNLMLSDMGFAGKDLVFIVKALYKYFPAVHSLMQKLPTSRKIL